LLWHFHISPPLADPSCNRTPSGSLARSSPPLRLAPAPRSL
jgi:hypothetical protein